jgi:predicted ArsR family transcriptional regulator
MQQGKSTRRTEILSLIKRHGELTVKQLSGEIGITTMGIRQHLAALEGENLVECRMQRQKVGRPVQVYSLTQNAEDLFPSGYVRLLLSILDVLVELDGPGKLRQVLKRRTERLLGDYRQRMNGLTLPERFKVLAGIRDEEGCMCEAVVDRTGKCALIEHHCPTAMASRKYPEMCQYEMELFEQALGVKLVRKEHMGSGGKCCTYYQAS